MLKKMFQAEGKQTCETCKPATVYSCPGRCSTNTKGRSLMEERHQCYLVTCNKPLPPQQPGRRPRLYCSDACKQKAYRAGRTAKKHKDLQEQWQFLPAGAQRQLMHLVDQYGEEAGEQALEAIHACFADVDLIEVIRCHRRWYQSTTSKNKNVTQKP